MKDKNLAKLFSKLPKPWRVFAISLIGYLVVIVGIIMLPLPGPGSVIIWFGLGILALEFEWARQASKQGQQWLEKIVYNLKKRINKPKN